jgi:DNA-binding CsgD family transcriptional regulator
VERQAQVPGGIELAGQARTDGLAVREPPGRRVRRWLTTARAVDEQDRRRELALNWILMASIVLALMEAAQRVVPVVSDGLGSDHGPTFLVACAAAATFAALLALSRRGRQVLATWGLLCAYYAVLLWGFGQKGTEEPAALVVCAMLVVSAGVLLGTRVAAVTVIVITATLVIVRGLDADGTLKPDAEGPPPSLIEELEIAGGLAAIALVLSARTAERRGSVHDLLSGVDGAQPPLLADGRIGMLTVRELQVARLVARGRSNDDIARELFVSPRTVHTHVSNALRKTGCSNRTELAVLAIQEPGQLSRTST